MTALNKQALRGQCVEGSFYLVECCNCGEMYPSNLLDGGEAIADSGDYGDCYCHLCGADDTERADFGDVNSNEAKAWNFQQKRIETLLDELVKEEGYASAYEGEKWHYHQLAESEGERANRAEAKLEAAGKRIAELNESHRKLRDTMATIHNTIRMDGGYTPLAAILNAAKRAHEESATAAGIGVKGE